MNKTLLALGCSHTAGVGLVSGQAIYVDLVGQWLGYRVINRSVPGGNANECLRNLVEMINIGNIDLVIAQWPNIFRRTFFQGQAKQFENVNAASSNFLDLLKIGEKNFVVPWVDCITCADLICKLAEIPIYHVYLDTLDIKIKQELSKAGVLVHDDQKIPGHTWFFDSAAVDGMHHSVDCHAKWAERLFGIINENSA